ncbi:MAG: DUF481 domain-containing protein [Planctomycetota bacterium]
MSTKMTAALAAMVAGACVSGSALAQQASPDPDARVLTAGELLEALRAAGVEIPEGVRTGEDGSVVIPGAMVPDEVAQPEEEAPVGEAAQPDGAAGEGERLQTPGPDGEAAAIPAPEPEVDKWKNFAELSLTYSDGNTETLGFRTAIESIRDTERSKLTLRAQYLYETDGGEESKDQARVDILHDWLFPEKRHLYFVEGRYDYDEFEAFLHRTSLSGGIGYRLIDNEKTQFTVRGGLGFTREFDSPRDEIFAEALAGFDWDQKISENNSFNVRHRTFVDLNEGDEFRLLTDAAWRLKLDDLAEGLTLSAGLQHEYRTAVSAPTNRNDVNAFISLGVAF